MNKFIRARLIGARALMLSCGAHTELNYNVKDSLELSYMELKLGYLPLEIKK